MGPYHVVVVGTSYGGLQALSVLLGGLPAGFEPAVVVVQHRSRDSDDTLSRLLGDRTPLPVVEVDDKDVIEAGHVFIAPPDYHLLIEGETFALSTEAPVAFSRPSIDVLFESAAEALGERVIGVLLTGANADGAAGLVCIKQRGGYAIVQDPETAVGRAMPAAGVATEVVDVVLPLERIAGHLVEIATRRRAGLRPSRN
jgi:two-component system chemotaxis response regulator CheB